MSETTNIGDRRADGYVWDGNTWMSPEQFVENGERLLGMLTEHRLREEALVEKVAKALWDHVPKGWEKMEKVGWEALPDVIRDDWRARARPAIKIAQDALYDELEAEEQREAAEVQEPTA